MSKSTAKRVYKVQFLNNGRVYEIYAREVSHGTLFGFVELDGLLFGEKTQIVIDPAEESLQREFADVNRTFIPLHAVVRIDEVEKRGAATIRDMSEKAAVPMISPLSYKPAGKD